MTDITTTTTDAGFVVASFNDAYERECSIQEMQTQDGMNLWLGINGNRMQLTREMVVGILPYLNGFAESGGLPDDVEVALMLQS